MSLKQTISIDDFEGKAFQIRLIEGIEDKAVLTHYLHNYRNGVKKHYEKDALSSLQNFVQYKQTEEEISILAGYQKGFADTRGTLFFDIEQIIVKHKPKVVFLENVKLVA